MATATSPGSALPTSKLKNCNGVGGRVANRSAHRRLGSVVAAALVILSRIRHLNSESQSDMTATFQPNSKETVTLASVRSPFMW